MKDEIFYFRVASKDGVEKKSFINSKPYICPVCNGRGFVQKGFYDSLNRNFVTSYTDNKETCRTCKGCGIVWGESSN